MSLVVLAQRLEPYFLYFWEKFEKVGFFSCLDWRGCLIKFSKLSSEKLFDSSDY